jgi:hypothetical protein
MQPVSPGKACGGEQDDADGQSSAEKGEKQTPILCPMDAPAGAEHEFEQAFHGIPATQVRRKTRCTGFAAIERRGTFGGYSRPGLRAEGGHTSYRCCVIYILPGIEWTYLKLLANYCQRQNANARLALPKPLSAANDSSKRLFRHDLSLI